jgi:hypothetical protein
MEDEEGLGKILQRLQSRLNRMAVTAAITARTTAN